MLPPFWCVGLGGGLCGRNKSEAKTNGLLIRVSGMLSSCVNSLLTAASLLEECMDVQEDARIIELVEKLGPARWSLIAQELPGRIGKQARERCLFTPRAFAPHPSCVTLIKMGHGGAAGSFMASLRDGSGLWRDSSPPFPPTLYFQ